MAGGQSRFVLSRVGRGNREKRLIGRERVRMMIARNSESMRFNRIDQQSYWLYEFPSAA